MNRLVLPFLVGLIFIAGAIKAQEEEMTELSLEDLLDMSVSVASKVDMTQQESPAIITLVTEQEIKKSGARDLIDVLRLVPGIEFGMDVQGAVGLSMRGNWGHEGKVLLMIDGQEFNELSYSTVLYGNHFPVDNIKRIEIIRGPGSSIYGGYAELGVLNIITKTGEEINGLETIVNYGHTGESSRSNIGIITGTKKNDFEFALSGFYSDGNRADREYRDVYGDSYLMKDNSDLTSMMINSQIGYKGLDVRFIYDDYKTKSRDFYDENLSKPYSVDFSTLAGEIKYEWITNSRMIITPKVRFINTNSWRSLEDAAPADEDLYEKWDAMVTRIAPGISFTQNVTEKINLVGGVEYTHDISKIKLDGVDDVYYNGSKKLEFFNAGAYAQSVLKSDLANLTIGLRGDYHSEYGSAFAPRVGVTKVLGKFHTKLLFSMAYRTPGVENISNNAWLNPNLLPDITPERTNVIEFEGGYKLSENMLLTLNLYNIKIKDVIVYYLAEDGSEGYKNGEVTGTKGLDVEYKWKQNWGYVNANYSFYSTKGINKVADFEVPTNNSALLGTPQHKFNLNSSINIYKGLSVNPSLTLMGKRYAYTTYDENIDDVVLTEMDGLALFNIFLNYNDLFMKGLNFGVGVYNLLNAEYDFIQPYNGWHAPYPSKGLEMMAKLSYKFNLK